MSTLSEQERQRQGNPTRVDIKYKVKDGTPEKRIPFRAGVMANLSGHTKDLPPLYEREFISIDKTNFDDVMKRMNVTLDIDVKDTLSGDDKTFNVELKFEKFADFHPSQLIEQVPRLKALYDKREKLRIAKQLLSKGRASDEATKMIKELGGE